MAALSPGAAIMVDAGTFLVSAACLFGIRVQRNRRTRDRTAAGSAPRSPTCGRGPATCAVRRGCGRRSCSRWSRCCFLIGPIDVLIPFAVSERLDAGAGAYGVLLTAFGIGSAMRCTGDLVAAAATSLPDDDAAGLGPGLAAHCRDRPSQPALGDGHRDADRRRHRGGRRRDLGNAAAAAGARSTARARVQPRLLRLAGSAAGVDGSRRSRRGRLRHHHGLHRRRRSCRRSSGRSP